MRKRNEKPTFGSARYAVICILYLYFLITPKPFQDFWVSFVLSLQGIFSEIDLEKDAENELQQSEFLQNNQKGTGTLPSVCLSISKSFK